MRMIPNRVWSVHVVDERKTVEEGEEEEEVLVVVMLVLAVADQRWLGKGVLEKWWWSD